MPVLPPYHLKHTASAESVPRVLRLGPADHDIDVPRVDDALVENVEVDKDNPWFSTDGICLFSKDGSLLVRCLARTERYDVPPTCTAIEDGAFAYNTVIRHVAFPDGLARIGSRAFIGTTLESVQTPPSLQSIGDSAFASGKCLAEVLLNKGLEHLGDDAFHDNAHIRTLHVPSSVRFIGNRAFSQCKMLHAAADSRTLFIDPGNEAYFADERGVLYRLDSDGLVLVEALDAIEGSYTVLDGTARIRGRAFSHNRNLESVTFPGTLRVIGNRAFLECGSLTAAPLPEGLVSIGDEAFYHTSLSHVRIPSTLKELGTASLVVSVSIAKQGNNDGTLGGRGARDFYKSTLSGRLHEVTMPRFAVEVAPGNKRFSLAGGFLCEKPSDDGPRRAIQFVGTGNVVHVPRDVERIADYALFGVENVRELHVHTGIVEVGHSGLSVSYPLDLVEIDDGEADPIRLYPALSSSGTIAQRKAFRTGTLDLDLLVRDCDASLSFMTPGDDRTHRMLMRLANGRMLSDARSREFEATIRMCLDSLVRMYARLENRDGVRMLFDLGFIDAGNVAHAIETANEAGGVACARLLLEEKRARFGDDGFDFTL